MKQQYPLIILCLVVLLSNQATANPAQQQPPKPTPTPKPKVVHPPEHQHHQAEPPASPAASAERTPAADHTHHSAASAMFNTITGGPFRSMLAMGSGTGLLPASSPMFAWHWMPGEWMVMAHASIRTGLNHQGGPRGVGKAESQNWVMVMAERNAGRGRLMLRGMVTAEPLTTPHGGFPQLFQTGETYRQRPIIDAQHPHDLFMELAASYTLPLAERVSLQFYGGPVGEPALGPVAFMHRLSAIENPAAPLSHHWQDSTHITHGVVTAALTAGKFKLESSLFHGREPDEDRVRLDLGKLDSHSFRLWYTPAANWAMQVSWGKLKNPETVHPGDLKRLTASVAYNRPLARGNWASTLVWGRNDEYDPFFDQRSVSNAYLFESTLNFADRNHVYTRLELLDKQGLLVANIFRRPGLATDPLLPRTAESAAFDSTLDRFSVAGMVGADLCVWPSSELRTTGADTQVCPYTAVKPNLVNAILHPDPNELDPFVFNHWRRVGAFTFGGVRDLLVNEKFRVGLGADVTFYYKPGLVTAIYGNKPVSYHVFLRFRPNWLR